MTELKPSPDAGKRPRRLGRGLNSLLSDPVAVAPVAHAPGKPALAPVQTPEQAISEGDKSSASDPRPAANEDRSVRLIPLADIVPNRFQPRRQFEVAALERLADSIRTAGIMQPIVVRPSSRTNNAHGGAAWELIAGERRWRAAERAGLTDVPAIIADLSDQDTAEWSLIENLQREDLNPIERAHALRRLHETFGLTQAMVAERVGLERSSVANLIRLTELETSIQDEISAGRLTLGHGKALLGLPGGAERTQLAIRARDGGWSVRRLEQMVQVMTQRGVAIQPDTGRQKEESCREAARRELERRLRERLSTKVRVHQDAGGVRGRIVVEFFDLDQLEGVLAKMGVFSEQTP